MNQRIRQLAMGLMALYIVLFVALNYWQVGKTEELASRPSNTRALIRQFDSPRGQIITADGVVIAESVRAPIGSDVKYLRQYPAQPGQDPDLFAHITGYYTFGLGSTQIEKTQNDVLSGTTFTQQVRAIGELFSGDEDQSGSVQVTLREDMQSVAKYLLGPREGSIVLMEVKTGAIKAMWSYPSFDPNMVANIDYNAAYQYVTELQADERDPLLANAYQQRYMPGSTFKVLTTGAALDAGVVSLDTVFPVESEFVPPQTDDPIQNYNGTSCGGTLYEVFVRSCNTPFARTALELGPDRFQDGIGRWGVGDTVPIDLPGAASSTIGDFTDIDENLPLLAMRGFGQNEDQMVPLHMAMVAAAVANDGAMMKPYVVEATFDHQGNVIDRADPQVWQRPISRQTANTLRDLMRGVAVEGTASCCIALENGISVAAKTGTAQLNGPGEPERSHAWIVAFAPVEDPKYAVAVMLKGTNAEISASTGGRLAGPIAKAMLDEMFRIDPPAPAATVAPTSTVPSVAPATSPATVPGTIPATVPAALPPATIPSTTPATTPSSTQP